MDLIGGLSFGLCSLGPTVKKLKTFRNGKQKCAFLIRQVQGCPSLFESVFFCLVHNEYNPVSSPQWLEELESLIGQWMFPSECRQREGSEDAAQQLKRYMELLQNRVPPMPSLPSPMYCTRCTVFKTETPMSFLRLSMET